MHNKRKSEYVTLSLVGKEKTGKKERKWKNSPSQYLSGAFLTSPDLLELLS